MLNSSDIKIFDENEIETKNTCFYTLTDIIDKKFLTNNILRIMVILKHYREFKDFSLFCGTFSRTGGFRYKCPYGESISLLSPRDLYRFSIHGILKLKSVLQGSNEEKFMPLMYIQNCTITPRIPVGIAGNHSFTFAMS